MKLYKYHAVKKNSLCALAQKKIWASNPRSFNDPFDCEASLLLISFHPAPVLIGPGGSLGMTQGSIMDSPLPAEQDPADMGRLAFYDWVSAGERVIDYPDLLRERLENL